MEGYLGLFEVLRQLGGKKGFRRREINGEDMIRILRVEIKGKNSESDENKLWNELGVKKSQF